MGSFTPESRYKHRLRHGLMAETVGNGTSCPSSHETTSLPTIYRETIKASSKSIRNTGLHRSLHVSQRCSRTFHILPRFLRPGGTEDISSPLSRFTAYDGIDAVGLEISQSDSLDPNYGHPRLNAELPAPPASSIHAVHEVEAGLMELEKASPFPASALPCTDRLSSLPFVVVGSAGS